MHLRRAALATGLALGLMSGAAKAAYIVTFQQVGTNVVATGSGSLNTTGLSGTQFTDTAQVQSSIGDVLLGPTVPTEGTQYSVSVSGPGPFGTGDLFLPDIGSGNFAGIISEQGYIGVPLGYESGSDLGLSTDTWSNASFATLGLTPGTYVYSYSAGGGQVDLVAQARALDVSLDTFTVQIGTVPLPSAAPLFGAALLGLGALGYGMKRRSQAQAA